MNIFNDEHIQIYYTLFFRDFQDNDKNRLIRPEAHVNMIGKIE